MKELKIVFGESLADIIGNDKNHGWGVDDSLIVIESIVAQDAENEIERLAKAGKPANLYTLSDGAKALIKKVINPSAFRQFLEATKRANGSTWLAKQPSKGNKPADISDYLASL